MTLLIIIQLLISGVAHDFHVSRCEVNWNKAEDVLEASVFVYLDDLEDALSMYNKQKLHLASDQESDITDGAILDYLNKQLLCTIDSEETTWVFLGKETSDDLLAFWIHIYAPIDKSAQQIVWSNEILLDLYEDQKNIVEFTFGSKKEHMLLYKGNSSATIKL